MSVILKGDIVSNFGTYLSAPYIRKVAIQDAGIVATFSIFINVEEDQDVNSMISDLDEKIYFYFYATADPDRFENIVDKRVNIFEHYDLGTVAMREGPWENDPGTVSLGDYYTQMTNVFDMTSDSDGITTYDNLINDSLYDAEGNRVWEFRAEVEMELGQNEDFASYTKSEIAGLWILFLLEHGGGGEYLGGGTTSDPMGLYICAFSSLVDTNATDELETNLENITLLNSKTSDISYQIIFENLSPESHDEILSGDSFPFEAIPSPVQVEFFDGAGAIYDQVPLQSIQSPYYKVDKITHRGIVEYFEELVSEFEERAPHSASHHTRTKDRILEKMLNNVSFVLKKYGAKANLLLELNKLRQIFPSKSSATKTGQFYNRFNKRIFTINKTIEEGTNLRKKVIRNAKLRDVRMEEAKSWEIPDTFIDIGDAEHSYYLYDNWYVSIEFDDESNIFSSYGYWFFDYEKALKTNSMLALLVDVSKIKDLFEIEVPYEYFYIENAGMWRTTYATSDEDYALITSTMASGVGYPLTEYNKYYLAGDVSTSYNSSGNRLLCTDYSAQDYAGTAHSLTTPTEDLWAGFGQEFPTLVVRNAVLNSTGTFSEKLPDYRLVTFAFEDFMDDILGTSMYAYGNKVVIQDSTINIMKILIETFATAISEFAEYLELTENTCSFNDTSAEFNTFFADGVVAKYQEDETEPPWYKLPILYTLHKDLVFDSYGGDKDLALEDAVRYINNINPYNGSLEEVQNFYEKVKSFYEDQYEYSGTANNIGYYIEVYPDDYVKEVVYAVDTSSGTRPAMPDYTTTGEELERVYLRGGTEQTLQDAMDSGLVVTSSGLVREYLDFDAISSDSSAEGSEKCWDEWEDAALYGSYCLQQYLTYVPADGTVVVVFGAEGSTSAAQYDADSGGPDTDGVSWFVYDESDLQFAFNGLLLSDTGAFGGDDDVTWVETPEESLVYIEYYLYGYG